MPRQRVPWGRTHHARQRLMFLQTLVNTGVSGAPQALLLDSASLLLDPASRLGPHPHLQILDLLSERPQRRRHSPLGVLEQALGALEQVRGGCLALAALGQLPPALLCL